MRDWKKIEKGIYKIGEKVYFRLMVDGRRKFERARLQGTAALDERGRATKDLRKEFRDWMFRLENGAAEERAAGPKMPSFQKVCDIYEIAARENRVKTGKPCEKRVYNVLQRVKGIVEACGFEMSDPADRLTEQAIDAYVCRRLESGAVKEVSVWGEMADVVGPLAGWMKKAYEREGYQMPAWKVPSHGAHKSERYKRLTKEQRGRVQAWYDGLWDRNRKWWLAATMMMGYAMRNSDVTLMTGKFFKKDEKGRWWLEYMPHKTSRTSRRTVRAFVSDERMAMIREAAGAAWESGGLLLEIDGGTGAWWQKLSRDFDDATKLERTKTLYELRKLCTDWYYRNRGVEAAVSISGDDIKTILYYYSNPEGVGTDNAVEVATILE